MAVESGTEGLDVLSAVCCCCSICARSARETVTEQSLQCLRDGYYCHRGSGSTRTLDLFRARPGADIARRIGGSKPPC